MVQDSISLGGFGFERRGEQIILRSPEGSVEAGLQGFLRGARHLLKMDFDLEGAAELDGGLVFRVEGERVRLKLGQYTEFFPADNVSALFEQMTTAWASEA